MKALVLLCYIFHLMGERGLQLSTVKFMVMRKASSALLALLLMMALGTPAHAGDPAVRPYYFEYLNAEFSVRVDDHIEWFVVRGKRKTDLQSGKETLTGAAYRGRCVKGECLLSGTPVKVVTFKTADDYSWAVLRLSDGRQIHSLRFVAGNPYSIIGPGLWGGNNPCGGKDIEQYGRNWNAQASGKVFGRRVSTAKEAVAKERESEKIETSYFLRSCP